MVSVKRVRRKHAETIYLRAFIWYNSMENLVCGGVRFMVFSSITFLFVFLAAVLLLSAVCPMRFQNYLLLAASLAFYVWGEWRFAGILVLSTLFDYGMGLLIGYFRKKEQKRAATAALIVTVSGNLLVLGVFKYSGLLVRSINALGASFRVPSFVLPLGISFYTFQQMSYIIDVYCGNVKPQKNPLTFGTYVMLFPQLIAGPIVRYSEIEEQLAERKRTVTGYAEGVRRFVCGLAKKVLLANSAGAVYETITANTGRSAVLSWLGMFLYAFQIYYDFSGYSDMAIGLGKMFGFTFPENFDHPYEAKSATEFWRRWHITLSTWFREYVYIPLGGSRKGTWRTIRNLLIVWALTGFWHGAAWNFLLWGLYWFVFLTIEKFVIGKKLEKVPSVFRHVYALLLILFGWVLFANENLSAAGSYIASLFRGPFVNAETGYVFFSNLGVILPAALFCTSLPGKWAAVLKKKTGEEAFVPALLRTAVMAVVFLLCVACLIRESYNPFLYFRF